MKKCYLLFLVTFSLLIFSCKRTHMKGDLERFVGTWEWEKAVWEDSHGAGTMYLLADNQPYQYTIRITTKGEMILFKDGVELSRMNLKVDDNNCDGSNCTCKMVLKEKENQSLAGITYSNCDGTERLKFFNYGFPYNNPYDEANYFVRVE